MILLTSRFDEALTFARQCHDDQNRKGTQVPYISHPIGVASLVLEFGGNEDEAIAGLLHDALEDGVAEYALEIKAKFGSNVLSIVRDYRDLGDEVWDRFNSDLDENCWYYSEMAKRLNQLGVAPAKELLVKYAEFCRLVEKARNDAC